MLTAYGPGGGGILITRKSPREMFITKSGREILETFKGHHPFLDLIIASIKVTLQQYMWSVHCVIIGNNARV